MNGPSVLRTSPQKEESTKPKRDSLVKTQGIEPFTLAPSGGFSSFQSVFVNVCSVSKRVQIYNAFYFPTKTFLEKF